jgi:hypothetical protein
MDLAEKKVHSAGLHYFRKIRPSSILLFRATSYSCLQSPNSAHSFVSRPFLLHTAVGNGAMNKFENYSQ